MWKADLRLVRELLPQQLEDGLEEAHVGLRKEVIALGDQRVVHTLGEAQQRKVDQRQQVRPGAGGRR